ncbi:hypothetical protein KCM76_22235 [Zooshikella marina]|uniref:hypothetical protein n=1 Tax=Zooshikella ganghwensis TaxID=202772 RepID=UPI001BB0B5A8|nr:hypothetical protein [Zooshikella ganghwensis]MBU2708728.1 hypothetical protein [Zooshikella ganghwensis]
MKNLLALFLVVILSGCAGVMAYKSGTPISAAQTAEFKKGVTTRNQITTKFGAPQKTESVGNEIHYVYQYTEINHLAANRDESTRFVFNSKTGKLIDIQRSASAGNTNSLFQSHP